MYQRIFQTNDFTKFAFLPQNRDIKQQHVEKLKESILRENRLHLHPIIVHEKNGKIYVVDGQHRLQACKDLNIPINYVINESPTEASMIDDQISLSWDLKDRLKYFTEKEYPEYIKFKELIEKYEFPFSALFSLLGAKKYHNGQLFKSGNLKIGDQIENFIKDSHELYRSVLKNYPESKKVLFRRDFLHAIFWFYKKFPKEFRRLIYQLKNNFPDIPEKATRKAYEIFLITSYNKVKEKKGIKHPDNDKNEE